MTATTAAAAVAETVVLVRKLTEGRSADSAAWTMRDSLKAHSVAELRAFLAENGVRFPAKAKREEFVAEIVETYIAEPVTVSAEENLANEAQVAWEAALVAPVAVKVDELVGRKLVDFDGSILVVGEPVAEPYLVGYRVLYNVDGVELDQSYHESYLATLATVEA